MRTKYLNQLQDHFGSTIANRIIASLDESPSVSVRLNPVKAHASFTNIKSVPWIPHGFLLSERPSFSTDPLFHAGTYYVQDSSSMMLWRFLEDLSLEDPLVLDACAAPGGKSTLILDWLDDSGFLIANEVDKKRLSALNENILKWGRTNVATSSVSTAIIGESANEFDVIVIDAPCSGEGMFRKDDFARTQWSENLVDQCSTTQTQILDQLKNSLAVGGYLIYSTCTTNSKENEDQVLRMLESGEFELTLPNVDDIEDFLVPAESNGTVVGYYLLPGISTGEGLFISRLMKTSTGVSRRVKRKQGFEKSAIHPELSSLGMESDGLDMYSFNGVSHAVRNSEHVLDIEWRLNTVGLPYFTIKGKDLIPQHGVAMNPGMNPTINLNKEDALKFLRKETISLRAETGWHLVGYEGASLGWVKVLPSRVNNYYPQWLRLRI